MIRATRRRPALLPFLAGLILLAGCGDPDLWARFQAERAMWRANRLIQRITIQPRLATARDYDCAEAACERLVSSFPAAVWATPERLGDPVAREVAVHSARAALALGRIAEIAGRHDAALERYEAVLNDWGQLREAGLEAAVSRASVFEGAGRTEEAAAAWARVVTSFDVHDPAGRPVDDVLAAPRRAAALERELGREQVAVAILREGQAKLLRRLEVESDSARAAIWWEFLARDRSAAGEPQTALEAWRRALEAAPPEAAVARIRLAMADEALELGRPDSALVTLVPLLSAQRLETRLDAFILRGRAFAARGQMDSALAAWDAVADDHPNSIEAAARARFLRGVTLEAAGRWDEGRAEFRGLGAAYPAHRLAIEAMGRIVEYHARQGQAELARLEGLRAIDALDRLILRQRDLDVQFEARRMRARLLDRAGPASEACDALTEFWRRYPRSRDGQAAGLRAAALADSVLHDRARAVDLYREMATRELRSTVRAQVRARLGALGETE
jgi:tetratricopeptide (TPR) repeat protein